MVCSEWSPQPLPLESMQSSYLHQACNLLWIRPRCSDVTLMMLGWEGKAAPCPSIAPKCPRLVSDSNSTASLTLWGFSLSPLYPGFINLGTCSCPPLGCGLLRGQRVLIVVTIRTRETLLRVPVISQHCAFYMLAHLMLLWGCDLLSYGCRNKRPHTCAMLGCLVA